MSSDQRRAAEPQLRRALEEAGAVFGDSAEEPTHFGDPVAEQRRYEAGSGAHYAGPIGVVSITGPDRLSWLTTLSSQVVTDLGPGESKELLFLDPNGRIEFAVGAVDHPDEETTWLLLEPGKAADLVAFLESMRFMLRVEVADRSCGYTAFQTVGSDAETVPEPVQSEAAITWRDPWPGLEEGGARYYVGRHPGSDTRFQWHLVPADSAPAVVEACEGTLVGSLAAEATRVAAWRPRVASEVDERSMPAELDWLRTAVHLEKGCYRGQESVARINNLGRPPRRLTFLQLDGSRGDLPAPGDPVMGGERQVGTITSVARHAEMGPIALALLKRNLDPDLPLTMGEVAAAQELIVPVDGRSDHAPAQRPGAGLKRLPHGGRDLRTSGPGTAR